MLGNGTTEVSSPTRTYTMYTMHVPRQKQGTRCEPPTFPFSKTETTTAVVNATTTLHFSYCCCLLLVMGHFYSVSLRFRGSQIGGGGGGACTSAANSS